MLSLKRQVSTLLHAECISSALCTSLRFRPVDVCTPLSGRAADCGGWMFLGALCMLYMCPPKGCSTVNPTTSH
jgi:hypothetical protein